MYKSEKNHLFSHIFLKDKFILEVGRQWYILLQKILTDKNVCLSITECLLSYILNTQTQIPNLPRLGVGVLGSILPGVAMAVFLTETEASFS